MNSPLAKLFILLLIVTKCTQAQQTDTTKEMLIPTETDVGRVYLSNLVTTLNLAPPDKILIYPSLFAQNEDTVSSSNEFSALIEGSSIIEFLERISKPTSISSADETCPNIIFCWQSYNSEPHKTIAPSLKGNIYIGAKDYVRLRLNTDNSFYPKIDFVYVDTGLSAWLQTKRANVK